MPPSVEDRLRDILEAIAEIEDIVQGANFDQLVSDRRMRLVVERLLEIVCEASRHLSDEVKQEAPDIDWRRMIDFGNVLRHAYQTTDAGLVWDTVKNHLPPLKSFVQRRIRASGS